MGKVIRTILICGVFICCGMLLLRIALVYYYPAGMKKVLPNSVLSEAWSAAGDEARAVTQKPEIPYDDKDRGHFFFNYPVFIPCASQVQITVRYNNSTLEDIAADLSLAEIPDGDDAQLRFVLRDSSGKWYPVSLETFDSAFVYNYRRLVFDGVDLAADGYLYLDVYYGEADYSTDTPYGSMLIYITEAPVKEYQMSQSELGK